MRKPFFTGHGNGPRKRYLTPFVLLAILLAAGAWVHRPVAKPPNPFFTYTFGMDKYPPAGQVDLLSRIGYDGVTFPVTDSGDLKHLETYQQLPAVRTGKFRIYSVFTWIDVKEPDLGGIWHPLLGRLKGTETSLWVILPGTAEDGDRFTRALATIADSAARYRVQVVVYPHDGDPIASVAQALPYLKKLNRPNLKLSLHLCHELRAGNKDRLAEVVREAMPYLSLVTLNGADTVYRPRDPDWSDAIKPLYEGSYDAGGFVRTLRAAGYRGPVGLHTFGITADPEVHLRRSFETWQRMNRDAAAGQ